MLFIDFFIGEHLLYIHKLGNGETDIDICLVLLLQTLSRYIQFKGWGHKGLLVSLVHSNSGAVCFIRLILAVINVVTSPGHGDTDPTRTAELISCTIFICFKQFTSICS